MSPPNHHDFGDLEHHLRRYRKQLIVFNSKYTPRTREILKLTITTVDVGGGMVGVVTPFISWLQRHEDFIKQRTNPPTLRGYKSNYYANWLGRLQMVVTPMQGSTMRPLDVTLPKTSLFQRIKRRYDDIKKEPQENGNGFIWR